WTKLGGGIHGEGGVAGLHFPGGGGFPLGLHPQYGAGIWPPVVLLCLPLPGRCLRAAPRGWGVLGSVTAPHLCLAPQNEYMKDDFIIKIETWHKPDLGTQDNVHGLDTETWKDVEVVHIDIADRTQVSEEVRPSPDCRRELASNQESPHMCAYKLVTVNFRWWGLQGRMEKFIHKQEQRLFTNFNRQLFCWLDRWVDLSMADIRRMGGGTQKGMRQKGAVRGMAAGDE
uniref:Phosphatidylinositol transfer protein N-terminal domain-containing protein n=1 Tax=Terrapene triunguis TaxID=2587831 RepID=A0A674JUQ0_9SAUR